MPPSEPPRRNKQGREIWFAFRDDRRDDSDLGYAPVHPKGWAVLAPGAIWTVLSVELASAAQSPAVSPPPRA